jgi:hypothetical protein
MTSFSDDSVKLLGFIMSGINEALYLSHVVLSSANTYYNIKLTTAVETCR